MGNEVRPSRKMEISFLVNEIPKCKRIRDPAEEHDELASTTTMARFAASSNVVSGDLTNRTTVELLHPSIGSNKMDADHVGRRILGTNSQRTRSLPRITEEWPVGLAHTPDRCARSSASTKSTISRELHYNRTVTTSRSASPGYSNSPDRRCCQFLPPYSDEEKLFIMHHRVIDDLDWQEIWSRYKVVFGEVVLVRSIAGLTSLYYRVRHDWGMKHVMQATSDDIQSDKTIVSGKEAEHTANHGTLPWDHRRCAPLIG